MSEYCCYLQRLASLGLLKEAFNLYEQQTREFAKFGAVLEQTKQKIILFSLFCLEHEYENLVIIPLVTQNFTNKEQRNLYG